MKIIQKNLKPKWYRNTCPNCHQETSQRPKDWAYDDGCEFTNLSHNSPYDCIAYLSNIIADLVSDVESLKERRYESD